MDISHKTKRNSQHNATKNHSRLIPRQPGRQVKLPICLLLLFFLFTTVGCPSSQDAGQPSPPSPTTLTFRAQNSGLQPSFQVTAFAVDPLDPAHLVAALYHPIGLLESTDSGGSWQPIALQMVQTPADPASLQPIGERLPLPLHTVLFTEDRLLLGGPLGLHEVALSPVRPAGGPVVEQAAGWPTGLAVFQLVQGEGESRFAAGETAYTEPPRLWQQQGDRPWQGLPPLPAPVQTGSALLSVLQSGDQLLVGTDGAGLFSSTDGGEQWQWNETIGETFVAALWAAPWDGRLLLARTRRGLFRSIDGGTQWMAVSLPTEARVDAIHGFGDTTILLGLGDGSLLASSDNGSEWQPWGTPLATDGIFYRLFTPSTTSSTTPPSISTTLLAGTQNGPALSLDGGMNWQQPTLHNTPSTFYSATALAQNLDGTIYLGAHDGVYHLAPGKSGWNPYTDGLPAKRTLDLIALPAPQQRTETVLFAGTEVGLYRRYTNESQWQALGWAGGVPGLLADPAEPNRLYLRAAFERIYRTDMALHDEPNAVNWEQRAAGMATTHEILALAVDPTAPTIFYAGGATELFKSVDGAQSWRAIPSLLDGQSIFALLVDPMAPTQLYAGATNGLYRSRDGGETWQPWGEPLRNITVHTLMQHPNDGTFFFVGTKGHGLWYTADAGMTWQQAEGMPPLASVVDLLIDQEGTTLYAATDHGVWRAAWHGEQPIVNSQTTVLP